MRFIYFIVFMNVLFADNKNKEDLTFDFIYDSNEIFIGPDSIADFSGYIINISSDPILISVVRRINVDQNAWSSSICIGALCYSDWVDSVAVTIESGDTASLGVLVWTNGEGEDGIELDMFDNLSPNENITFNLGISSVGNVNIENERVIPEKYLVLKAYPNPFNPFINLELDLKIKTRIKVDIYDVRGMHIRTLFNDYAPRGTKNIQWGAINKLNEAISGGIYFCTIRSGFNVTSQKLIYVK